MYGLDLIKAEGITRLYNLFSESGRWKAKQVSFMEAFKGNALFECEVSRGKFAGPYLDEETSKWEIPVDFRNYAFSWHFLVKGLFEELKIPYHKFDNLDITWPKNRDQEFFEMLKTDKGQEFMDKVQKREKTFVDFLFNNVVGIKYQPKHRHNKKEGAFRKGDVFEIVADLDYNTHNHDISLEENIQRNFERVQDDYWVLPSSRVNGLIRLNF